MSKICEESSLGQVEVVLEGVSVFKIHLLALAAKGFPLSILEKNAKLKLIYI